jgi:hypothetical protein
MRRLIYVAILSLLSCFKSSTNSYEPQLQPSLSLAVKIEDESVTLPSFCTSPECLASDFQTTEYNNQAGLGQIKAAEAYAYLANKGKNWGGDDVLVGVIDADTITTHPELSHALNSYIEIGDATFQHGTNVTSVILAKKDDLVDDTNNIGFHGVAPAAKFSAINAGIDVTDENDNVITAIFFSVYQQAAFDALHAQSGMKIINMSFGGSSLDSQIKQKIKDGIELGINYVAAAGNSNGPNPNYPARNAKYSDVNPASISGKKGRLLAVAASNTAITGLASFSEHCGDAKNFCLVAPGDYFHIIAATGNSGYENTQGTSFSSPMVSGALAVLQGAWPEVFTNEPWKAADILLATASPISGCSEADCGQGLLNLEDAVKKDGVLSVASSSSMSESTNNVETTFLTIPNLLAGKADLITNKLTKAIMFDKWGRDYPANITKQISISQIEDNYLADYVTISRYINQKLNLTDSANAYLNIRSDREEIDKDLFDFSSKIISYDPTLDEEDERITAFSFNDDLTEKLNIELNFTENNYTEPSIIRFFSNENILNNTIFKNGYFNLLGNEITALRLRYRLDNGFSFNSKIIQAHNQDSKSLWIQDVTYHDDKKNISLAYARLNEGDQILAMQGEGAFNLGDNNHIDIYSLNYEYEITRNLALLANYDFGINKISGNNLGLIRDFSKIYTDQKLIALRYDLGKDVIGIIYHEPLAIINGSAWFDMPIGRDYDANVIRSRERFSLADEKRQRDVEIYYKKSLRENIGVSYNYTYSQDKQAIKSFDEQIIATNLHIIF